MVERVVWKFVRGGCFAGVAGEGGRDVTVFGIT